MMGRVKQSKGINVWVATAIIVLGLFAVYCLPDQAKGYTVGSFTAIFIAFVAYPWQKDRDRDLQIEVERRRIYVDSIRTIFATKSRLEDTGIDKNQDINSLAETIQKWLCAVNELEQAINTIGAIAPKEVGIAGGACIDSFRRIHSDITQKHQDLIKDPSDSYPRENVFDALRNAQKTNMEALDKAINEFLNYVRKHAFEEDGEVNFRSRIRDV